MSQISQAHLEVEKPPQAFQFSGLYLVVLTAAVAVSSHVVGSYVISLGFLTLGPFPLVLRDFSRLLLGVTPSGAENHEVLGLKLQAPSSSHVEFCLVQKADR